MAGSHTPQDSHISPTHDFSISAERQSFAPGADIQCRLQPGDIASQRYRIQSLIGQGGMGVVYKVEQIFLGKELALKVLSTRSVSPVTIRRFQHEARAAFGIDHPGLIAVHDFGLLDDKVPFLVMDYINGQSLADRIRQKGTLLLEEAVPIFLRTCFALGYAHQQGVVHRDIKPSNIMLVDGMPATADGSVKIVDFGIAKFTQLEKSDIQALTRTGEVFGSPLYMSPEQCSGSPVDERSDIYSLGCVFFEALTGTTPFVGANALSTMMLHMGERPPSLKEASMGKVFPPLLEQIIAKMLAKNVADRYQSLTQVAGDLAVLERSLPDPLLLANTVLVTDKPRQAVKEPREFKMARLGLYLAMFCLMVVSAVLSSLITISVNEKKTERKVLSLQEHFPPEDKSLHIEDLKRFFTSIETGNGRPDVSNAAILSALKYHNEKGKIRLKFLNLDDFAMNAILHTRWIAYLDIMGCAVKNDKLIDLAQLPHLEHLNISHSNLDDVGAAGIAHCPNLVNIQANWTNITDKAIPYFTEMPRLQRLEVSGVALTPLSIRFLAEKTELSGLVLSSVSGLNDASFAPMCGSNVRFLNVENVPIGDAAVAYLAQMRHLESIALGLTKITREGVERLLTNKTVNTVIYVPTEELSLADVKLLAEKYPHCRFLNRLQKSEKRMQASF